MEEDLKIRVSADTRKAEEGIEALQKMYPNMTKDIAIKFKNKSKLEQELKEVKNKLDEISLNPKLFSKEEKAKFTADKKRLQKELKELKISTRGDNFKEAFQEAKLLKERVREIKLNPKSFSNTDIKVLKAEIEATALKAKALNFAEGGIKSQKLVNDLKNSHKELGKIDGTVKSTNKIFGIMDVMVGNIAASLSIKALTGLKNLTLEGAKFAQQMEYANEKVRTISKDNSVQIDSRVWRMAKNSGVDPRELKEGLYQVVSAIGDTTKKYTLLDTANKLATTGFSSTTEAVDGLTSVLNAYNLSMDNSERIANIFVRTQKVGKLTVQEFNQQLYKTISVAKDLNIQIDEIGAGIALLTAKGDKAEIAQTKMAAFMYELLDVGSDVHKLFNQIQGQSVESFMSNGGDLEGILKTLKAYSEANNFKIESLFGRKEAKSFWLSVGNDIDGYINKLKAINEPTNELQRNFDNLLNTQEKRLARAKIYWAELGNTIGNVASQIVASLGDLVTGADTETAARQRLNNELEDNLKIFGELYQKQNLSKEEQETFNKALENLTILAPSVVEAFKNQIGATEEYRKALARTKQEAEALNLISLNKQIDDKKKDRYSLARELDTKTGYTKYQQEYYRENGERSNKTQEEFFKEKINEFRGKIDTGEFKYDEFRNLKAIYEEWLYLTKDIAELEKKEKEKVLGVEEKKENIQTSKAIDNNNSPAETKNNKLNLTNYEKDGKVILTKYNKEMLDLKAKYASDIKNKNSKDIDKLKNDFELNKQDIEDRKRIEKIDLEIKKLKDSIENQSSEEVSRKIENLTTEKNTIEADKNIRLSEKIAERNKKEEEETNKNKAKKIEAEELNIKNSFMEKRIALEKKFQEDVTEAEKTNSLERYKLLKEEREKELDLINAEEKIALLKLQKNKLDSSDLVDQEKIKNINNEISMLELQKNNKNFEEIEKQQKEFQEAINKTTRNLNNLANVFASAGNTTASKVMSSTASIIDTINNASPDFLKNVGSSLGIKNMNTFLSDVGNGATAGSTLDSLISGGSKEGQTGSLVGASIGAVVGGPVGAIVGSSIGGSIGGVFGSKKKKKKKREEKKRREAQERLAKGRISGQFKFQEAMELFNEELEKSGMAEKIDILENVSKNTNYDNNLTALQGAKRGDDGLSLSALQSLMPHMSEQEVIDWFKASTGGAVINGDTISTGEGKYGALDINALVQSITEANRELEKNLKETIKNIIDFSADKISGIVRGGFGDGIDDIGKNLEKAIADSLKNAFLQTELAKGLFNGLSDKVTDMIKEMFKNDKNLGIDLDVKDLNNLSIQEYIALIKKYMELGNEELKSIFEKLGISVDNLNNTVDKANKNSKNTVQGMATNLWLQNLKNSSEKTIDLNNVMEKMQDMENINKFSLENIEKNNFTKTSKEIDVSIPLIKALKNIVVEVPGADIKNNITLKLDRQEFKTVIQKTIEDYNKRVTRGKLAIIRG